MAQKTQFLPNFIEKTAPQATIESIFYFFYKRISMKKSLLLLSLSLTICTNTILCAYQKKNDSVEINKEALAQLDAYTKYAGVGSLAAIGAGVVLKNDLLSGIGLGTLSGISVGVLQKNYNWMLIWIAESFARYSLAQRLCATNPSDIHITNEELIQLERNVRNFSGFFTKGVPAATKEQMIADSMRDAHSNLRKSKALRNIQYSSQGASWISYLIYRYLEQQAENPA